MTMNTSRRQGAKKITTACRRSMVPLMKTPRMTAAHRRGMAKSKTTPLSRGMQRPQGPTKTAAMTALARMLRMKMAAVTMSRMLISTPMIPKRPMRMATMTMWDVQAARRHHEATSNLHASAAPRKLPQPTAASARNAPQQSVQLPASPKPPKMRTCISSTERGPSCVKRIRRLHLASSASCLVSCGGACPPRTRSSGTCRQPRTKRATKPNLPSLGCTTVRRKRSCSANNAQQRRHLNRVHRGQQVLLVRREA
mmetsp:Transcript_61434/g.102242  ORF Transcript_61434/g.102242 Transcript_61434/m.102242 type:complete len:254 (-) Transcript_61434:283-1044(-)